MRFADYELHITNHAFKQYCERVGDIHFDDLHQLCREQIAKHNYICKKEFMQLDGIWWVIHIRDGKLRLITCYGNFRFDLPEAKKWAKRNNDRIYFGK